MKGAGVKTVALESVELVSVDFRSLGTPEKDRPPMPAVGLLCEDGAALAAEGGEPLAVRGRVFVTEQLDD